MMAVRKSTQDAGRDGIKLQQNQQTLFARRACSLLKYQDPLVLKLERWNRTKKELQNKRSTKTRRLLEIIKRSSDLDGMPGNKGKRKKPTKGNAQANPKYVIERGNQDARRSTQKERGNAQESKLDALPKERKEVL